MAVVLFHAGAPGLGGGFIGVDVFFVISGFLITSQIASEMDDGRFSILRFYERRIRRIVPALVAVAAASGVLAWFVFMPVELRLFGWSVVAAMFSVSNVLFWQDTGYFDKGPELAPLLHTWSLGVEEQFYVLLPLLLLMLRRHPLRRRMSLAILAAVSFGISIWLVATSPPSAFYMIWSRAWELLLGSLVAIGGLPSVEQKNRREMLQALGLFLLVVPAFAYSRDTVFPGIAALPPCLGTALLLHTGGRPLDLPQRLLASAPLVGIGLVSYSLYLWHWPLIVFATYARGAELPPAAMAGVLGLSLGAAILSWRWVEQPFRRRGGLGRSGVFKLAGAGVAACTAFGLAVALTDGVPSRLPAEVEAIYAEGQALSEFASPQCFIFEGDGPSDKDVRDGRLCRLGRTGEGPIAFVLWGDSHAAAIAPGVDQAARSAGLQGLFIGRGSCPPLLGYQRSANTRHAACKPTSAAVLDLIARSKIGLVIMTARWPRYVNGTNLTNEGPFFDPEQPIEIDDQSEEVAQRLDATLTALTAAGARSVLVSAAPEIGYDVPYVRARAAWRNRTIDMAPSRDAVRQRQGPSLRVLAAAAQKHGARLLHPADRLCDEQSCLVEKDGHLLYRDEDHLSIAGARLVGPLFDRIFQPIATAQPPGLTSGSGSGPELR